MRKGNSIFCRRIDLRLTITSHMYRFKIAFVIALLVLCPGCAQHWGRAEQCGCTDYREPTGYVFTGFHLGAMYVFSSPNGVDWSLVGAAPQYFDPVKGYIVRDPSVIQVGSEFWVAYTDQVDAGEQPTFGIAKSTDLEHWTFVAHVPVPIEATNLWAPEWFRDRDGEIYVFFTASSDNRRSFFIYAIRALDTGFRSWSYPRAVYWDDRPIDPFVIWQGGEYRLFYKNDSSACIEYATSPIVYGPYLPTKTGNWAGWTCHYEGDALLRIGPCQWRVYIQGTTGGLAGYYFSDSADGLIGWSKPLSVVSKTLMQHGTPLAVH